jgi:holliday junction DNA helicase RuvA
MITRITGVLNRVLDDEVRLQVGPLEYQVLIPDFVRRQIQGKVTEVVTFHTTDYLDGNPMQGKMIPRLLGFLTEAELEFFELFCTVDKVGTRKAIKALIRPIREIANAIQRQDAKWLTTLPGIGPATAEQVVATLRRKVTKFALMASSNVEGATDAAASAAATDGNVLEDAYQALLSVGHGPIEARDRLDKVLAGGKTYKSVEDILLEIYKQGG